MTWVAVGVAAVGLVTSIAGGKSAKKAAKKAGKATAKGILETEKENAHRREMDLSHKLGAITATAAASNLQISGSARKYRTEFESRYLGEMAWDKQKARLDANTAKKGGQIAGDLAMSQGITAGIGFAGQIAGGLSSLSAANNGGTPFYIGKNPGQG